MKTVIGNHNHYNGKIVLNKKKLEEYGFKVNDKVEITKLDEGKILIEKVGEKCSENSCNTEE